MQHVSSDINKLTCDRAVNPEFPDAPEGWMPQHALDVARKENLELTDDHWEVVRALQRYFAQHREGHVNLRDLNDALDERFHQSGGIKQLYLLLPGGPVAQGCRLAGLDAPFLATDKGFGSVA